MLRSRLVVLALLLVGSAVSVIVYQLSNSAADIHTKILPSHPLNRKRYQGDSAWLSKTDYIDLVQNEEDSQNGDPDNVLLRGSEGETTGEPELPDVSLEHLGNSKAAQQLRLQAIQNRKEAAYIVEARKKLDGERFKFKVEQSRQAGLRKKLDEDLENFKLKQRLFEEEKKELSSTETPAPIKAVSSPSSSSSSSNQAQAAAAQPNTHPPRLAKPLNRNPLSVQGANLKAYLKKMNQNLAKNRKGASNNVDEDNDKSSLPQQEKAVANSSSHEETFLRPAEADSDTSVVKSGFNNKLSKLDGVVLSKLPEIGEFVQQGHFGYEHGRNGKASTKHRQQQAADSSRSKSSEAQSKATNTRTKAFDPDDIWEGLDPTTVARRHAGILLDGNYMLRPFIDPEDPRASGMEGKPTSIIDMTEATAEERFYQLVTLDHMHCGDIERMGNYGDGGWDICVSPPYKPSQNCLVYSFGINNDFSFDDAISNTYGCEVKAFDPSMNVGDHMHSSKVHFFNLGLGSSDGINNQAWKLRTFGSILKRLGHSNHIVDYLKIDIEFNEWDCFKTMIREHSLKNVKQFVFEIHTSEVYTVNRPSRKEHFLEWYNVLLGLEIQGFRRYHHHFNPNGQYTSVRTGKDRTCCYELYYVNIRFLK